MSATAPAKLPTPEQMKAYADELPDIYREIVKAIHRADPERHPGMSISPYAVYSELAESKLPYSKRAVEEAYHRLRDEGFLRDDTNGEGRAAWWEVTDLGEELIAAVTGRRAVPVEVPPLPKPKW